MFYIGDITMEVGNAFACSPVEHWKHERQRSPSGLSVMRAVASYDKLVNREGERGVCLSKT